MEQLTNAREPLRRQKMPDHFFETKPGQEIRPASVTIGKPLDEVYAFARDFTNMPRFIRGLKEVNVTSPTVSQWSFAKDGEVYHYDSIVIADEPLKMFAWKTLGTSSEQIGVVTFDRAAGGRGTVVSMRTSSDREPGKIVGAASYFAGQDPKSESYINLRRLKAYLETGEVPTIEGQPSGREEEKEQK